MGYQILFKKIFLYATYIFACIGFVLVVGFFLIKYGVTNEAGIIDEQRNIFLTRESPMFPIMGTSDVSHDWQKTEEWGVIRDAIVKDRVPIYKASALLDIDARTLVSILVVEQLRLFSDNREIFKSVFAPLKILGVQSKFSWGVLGIKEDTAIMAEQNLMTATSSFYLGVAYAHTLDFKTNDHRTERFERIVNKDDRYYSYLYTAVIMKELETQWKRAGYDISKKPEITSTLFNIGFRHSEPNAHPRSGGAVIPIDNHQYSFGSLALDFYNSSELTDFFPQEK